MFYFYDHLCKNLNETMSFIAADGFRLKIHIGLSAVHCHCLLVQVKLILRPILTTVKCLKYAGATCLSLHYKSLKFEIKFPAPTGIRAKDFQI
jgi:hypothetical protein